jgi:predicted nucleotidyltransferase
MDNLGDMIRKLRHEKKLPLRIVAAYLDIDQAILSRIERGKYRPARHHVVKLAEYFKVNEEDLLVAWLSDLLVYDVAEEHVALKALQVAEEKVAYQTYKKIDKKAIENTIKDYFEKEGHIRKAWLFGSFARDEDDYKSDIDVMIEVPADSDFSLFDLAEIQYQLEKLIPKKMDVVMKDGVKPQIMERIKPDLKIVYER